VSELVRELAARVLFLAVRWPKSVPAFCRLPANDQKLLLQDGWRELFLLTAAQFKLLFSHQHSDVTSVTSSDFSDVASRHSSTTSPPTTAAASPADNTTPVTSSSTFTREIRRLDDVIVKFNLMQVDATEYACLKGIVLFKTAVSVPSMSLTDSCSIAAIQDEAQLTLSRYIDSAYPSQPFRFGKLLLLLPCLRSVQPATIEDLFFRSTLGDIPVSRIVADMFASNGDV
jgi:nuclear receptor subfamily 2 group E protein 1